MGLVSGILTLPLAPVRGVLWLGDLLRQEVERQYYDPASIRRQLEEVDQARAAGQISDEEAEALQRDLLGRLIRQPGGSTS